MEQILADKYEISEKIGSGGTSIIYKARRLEDGAVVAVKVLREELAEDEQQAARFIQESLALSNLSHKNIVNILDVGKMQNGHDFIVMEYVEGCTLKEYIGQKGALPFEETIDGALQICTALKHAHENNVIHRDIKPQNVLIAKNGVLKVADFGTARLLDKGTLTMAGKDVIGSVHYISPEQVRGAQVDARSDIYSLGVVIYEMATGCLPYDGDEAVTVAMKHINHTPRRPIDVNPAIPQCLNDIIIKCMAKDPAKRYQTADELIEDLQSAANDPVGFTVFRAANEIRKDDAMAGKKRRKRRKKTKVGKVFAQKLIILVLVVLVVLAGLVALILTMLNNSHDVPVTPNDIVIQNFVGSRYELAKQWSLDQGLRLPKEPDYDYSDTYPEGTVISQSPAADERVKKSSTIRFTVSKGTRVVTVPDLKNTTVDEARALLEDADLVLGSEIQYVKNNNFAAFKIFEQSVPAKSEVAPGTVINVKVALTDALIKTVPDLVGKTEEKAKSLITDNNFTYGGMISEYSDTYPAGTVIRQEPAKNTQYTYDDNISIKIVVSLGTQGAMYNGSIEITPPPILQTSVLRIYYIIYSDSEDTVGTEETAYEREVNESTFAEGETIIIDSVSYSTDARIYYVELDGELVERVVMLFRDSKGRIVSTMPPEPDPTPEITEEPTYNPENTGEVEPEPTSENTTEPQPGTTAEATEAAAETTETEAAQ